MKHYSIVRYFLQPLNVIFKKMKKSKLFFKKGLTFSNRFAIITLVPSNIWGYSSAGRALEWHSRGQRFDPAYLHHRSLGNHWFSRLFAVSWYFYFARYFSDQSFDQNYEMSKKSNLFQEVGGSFLTSRFFHPTLGNCTTLQAPSVGLSGSVVSEVKALLNLAMASWRMLSCTWR